MPDDVRETLYQAVKYTLDRAQTDPDFAYHCCPLTETFAQLCKAEAAHLGVPEKEIRTTRAVDLQPEYRRREPRVVQLEDDVEKLQARIGQLEEAMQAAGVEIPGEEDEEDDDAV